MAGLYDANAGWEALAGGALLVCRDFHMAQRGTSLSSRGMQKRVPELLQLALFITLWNWHSLVRVICRFMLECPASPERCRNTSRRPDRLS